MIDIAFLGTGAMMPTSTRWLSSVLIRMGDQLALFDVGEGTQIPWREQGWGLRRLSLICLSHHHADHIAGIPGALIALANAERTEPMTIIGPKGTRALVTGLREAVPVLPFDVRVADLAPGNSWTWADMAISVIAGFHRGPVLLYRFDLPRAPRFLVEQAEAMGAPRESWSQLARGEDVMIDGQRWRSSDFVGGSRLGISFGIMTDTRPSEQAAEHFRGSDLLVAEGTYGDDGDLANAIQNKHMTFAEAATFARETGVKRLILTHFSPKMLAPADYLENATRVFPATQLATPGLEVTLNYPDD
jgi:ribonuclease Z